MMIITECFYRAQSKPDAGDLARIAALDKSIKASTATLEDLQEKSSSIEEDIKALEKKIIDIGGSRLLAQKSKVEGISLHIKLANDEITKAEVAKARAEKDSTKFDSAIANNTEALEALEAELEDIETKLEECTSYVNEIRKKVDQAKEAEDASKEDLENLKAELDEKTEGIQAFRKKEVYSFGAASVCYTLNKSFTDGASTDLDRSSERGAGQ
jgi:structural maintenance of chromosome 4